MPEKGVSESIQICPIKNYLNVGSSAANPESGGYAAFALMELMACSEDCPGPQRRNIGLLGVNLFSVGICGRRELENSSPEPDEPMNLR